MDVGYVWLFAPVLRFVELDEMFGDAFVATAANWDSFVRLLWK